MRPQCPGGLDAFAHALADDVALHLGERGLDLEEGARGRRGGVSMGEFSARNSDAALAELVDEGDEFAGETAEPVEVKDDEDRRLRAGSRGRAARFGRSGRGTGSVNLRTRVRSQRR